MYSAITRTMNEIQKIHVTSVRTSPVRLIADQMSPTRLSTAIAPDTQMIHRSQFTGVTSFASIDLTMSIGTVQACLLSFTRFEGHMARCKRTNGPNHPAPAARLLLTGRVSRHEKAPVRMCGPALQAQVCCEPSATGREPQEGEPSSRQ